MPRSRRQKWDDNMVTRRIYTTREVEAMEEFKILTKLVQPDQPFTATEALQEIDTLTSAAMSSDKSKVGEHTWSTFRAILAIAGWTAPPQQSKLVEFFVQLQKKKVLDPSTGEAVKIDESHGEELWTGLPTFALNILDAEWMIDHRYHDLWDPNLTKEVKVEYENGNAFLAQLSELPPEVDYLSIQALRAFRMIFENPVPTNASPTVLIRPVCWYYIYMADKLWANVKNVFVFEDKAGVPGDKYEKEDWEGYNRKRWDVWKQGLLDMHAFYKGGDTKRLIEYALAQIERVESS